MNGDPPAKGASSLASERSFRAAFHRVRHTLAETALLVRGVSRDLGAQNKIATPAGVVPAGVALALDYPI
jgi:hypothetical protein